MADSLKYKTVCITGTLQLMTREDAVTEITKAGGYFDKAVKASTSYLVVADKPGAVKVKQAKAFGTKTLTERQFLDMINNKPTVYTFKPDSTKVVAPPKPAVPVTLEERDW